MPRINKTVEEVSENTGYSKRRVSIVLKVFFMMLGKIMSKGMGLTLRDYFIIRNKNEKFKRNRSQHVDKF